MPDNSTIERMRKETPHATSHYLPPPEPTAPKKKVEAPAGSIPYAVLKQTHDEYDGEQIEKIDDLYRGGFAIQKKAAKYLVRLEGESAAKFSERCRIVAYQAHFGQIVDQFTSDVFGQPLSIKPAADADNPNTPGELPDKDFYPEFEKNADKRGTRFVDLMKETLRGALKQRYALVVVDAPEPDGGPEPVNLADEDSRGKRRCYAYTTPLGRLIDWKVDDLTGRFVWAVLYDRDQTRETPFSTRDVVRETFTLWTIAPEEGATAVWSRYSIAYKADQPPAPEDPVAFETAGHTNFCRIPLLRFDITEGLWVGNKVGPEAMEHWQRRSSLVGAENRSLVAIPYVKKGPQAPEVGGPIPSEISQDPSRGNNPVRQFNSKGWLELDAQDEVGFAEPEGKCYTLIGAEVKELKESMFQVTFQMAASLPRNNTSMGRSGLSKKKDEDLTGRVLRALGQMVREFAVDVFDVISKARGEDVHWTPHGLDGYDSEDREALLEEAASLDEIAEAIPSETFHKAHARSIAEKLLKGAVDVETLAVIIEEIEDGIEKKHEMMDIKRDVEKDQLLNPDPPDPMGGGGGIPPKKPAAPNAPAKPAGGKDTKKDDDK